MRLEEGPRRVFAGTAPINHGTGSDVGGHVRANKAAQFCISDSFRIIRRVPFFGVAPFRAANFALAVRIATLPPERSRRSLIDDRSEEMFQSLSRTSPALETASRLPMAV